MCQFLLVSVSGLKSHPFLVSALALGLNQKAGFGRRLGMTKTFKIILGKTAVFFPVLPMTAALGMSGRYFIELLQTNY